MKIFLPSVPNIKPELKVFFKDMSFQMVGMPDGAFVYIFGEECMEVRQLWRPTIMYTIYIQYIYIYYRNILIEYVKQMLKFFYIYSIIKFISIRIPDVC